MLVLAAYIPTLMHRELRGFVKGVLALYSLALRRLSSRAEIAIFGSPPFDLCPVRAATSTQQAVSAGTANTFHANTGKGLKSLLSYRLKLSAFFIGYRLRPKNYF